MKNLIIFVTLMFVLTGCLSTREPIDQTILKPINAHPIFVVEPLKVVGVDYSKKPWIEFSFELREKSKGIFVPDNIKFEKSSNPESKEFTAEAIKAFKLWVYFNTNNSIPYKTTRFIVRINAIQNMKQENHDCHIHSCIKL